MRDPVASSLHPPLAVALRAARVSDLVPGEGVVESPGEPPHLPRRAGQAREVFATGPRIVQHLPAAGERLPGAFTPFGIYGDEVLGSRGIFEDGVLSFPDRQTDRGEGIADESLRGPSPLPCLVVEDYPPFPNRTAHRRFHGIVNCSPIALGGVHGRGVRVVEMVKLRVVEPGNELARRPLAYETARSPGRWKAPRRARRNRARARRRFGSNAPGRRPEAPSAPSAAATTRHASPSAPSCRPIALPSLASVPMPRFGYCVCLRQALPSPQATTACPTP